MRIVWKEANAQAIAETLGVIQQETEECMRQARQVEAALKEADPDGTNKRLKAIGRRFEAAMARLRRAAAEAERLEGATKNMIRTFESSESDATRLLNSLEAGRGAGEQRGETAGLNLPLWRTEPRWIPPIPLPKPRIMPGMRISAMGPVMGWLAALIERE